MTIKSVGWVDFGVRSIQNWSKIDQAVSCLWWITLFLTYKQPLSTRDNIVWLPKSISDCEISFSCVHTSAGRKFGLVEGLSHDLECYFAWQVWHGQCSPGFKFNKLKSFSRGEIDQNHVDERILWGKGLQYEDSASITFVRPVRYATGVALTLSVVHVNQLSQKTVRRLNTHNFCPASASWITCCIDIKEGMAATWNL